MITIFWLMDNNEYIEEFNELKKICTNCKFKLIAGNIKENGIFEDCIVIMSGKIFRKNISLLQRNFFIFSI
jgi:hypothetical protein